MPYLRGRGKHCVQPEMLANCATNSSESVWYYCTARRAARGTCTKTDARSLHFALDAMYAQLASDFGGTVTYLPPSWMYDKLCTETTCGAEVPGTHTIAFVDQNHLSTAGSLYLGPFLNCFLHDSGLLSA